MASSDFVADSDSGSSIAIGSSNTALIVGVSSSHSKSSLFGVVALCGGRLCGRDRLFRLVWDVLGDRSVGDRSSMTGIEDGLPGFAAFE
jgi:hypothetical protein